MNILIVDDDKEFAEKLYHDLLVRLSQYDESIYIDILTSDFRHLYLNKDYSLVFLDIELLDTNGIQLAKQMNSILYRAHIVFVSSHNRLIQSSLIVHPYYFIDKSRYEKDMDILFELLQEEYDKNYYIQISYKECKTSIAIVNIKYIESSDHMIKIFINDNTIYYDNRRLRDILLLLPQDRFMQIHRSYIINLEFMTTHTGTFVTLFKNIEIPIGRKYRKNFKNKYEEFLIR